MFSMWNFMEHNTVWSQISSVWHLVVYTIPDVIMNDSRSLCIAIFWNCQDCLRDVMVPLPHFKMAIFQHLQPVWTFFRLTLCPSPRLLWDPLGSPVPTCSLAITEQKDSRCSIVSSSLPQLYRYHPDWRSSSYRTEQLSCFFCINFWSQDPGLGAVTSGAPFSSQSVRPTTTLCMTCFIELTGDPGKPSSFALFLSTPSFVSPPDL